MWDSFPEWEHTHLTPLFPHSHNVGRHGIVINLPLRRPTDQPENRATQCVHNGALPL
ncbi:hypothetical protein RR46_07459 [Papilio xuthus]|uniref:Uncharacterized protein n=1 Tax=Papilio xuthus TaxID=66420 RepID=A0A194PWL4_PAPXU|nr:hypothetical protein RR46_07459 [Papilio xuthus]